MLEQPQKLLVQNALAFGVALAELAEAVCVVGVKADKMRLDLALKVDDSTTDKVLCIAESLNSLLHKLISRKSDFAVICTVLPELCNQKCRGIVACVVRFPLSVPVKTTTDRFAKVASVDFHSFMSKGEIGNYFPVVVKKKISDCLPLTCKVNGIMMKKILDFGIFQTRKRINKFLCVLNSCFNGLSRRIFDDVQNVYNTEIHFFCSLSNFSPSQRIISLWSVIKIVFFGCGIGGSFSESSRA